MGREERLAAIRAALGRGEYLLAYDAADEAAAEHPDDAEIRYLLVLSLARAGAIDNAAAALDASRLEMLAPGLSPELHEDIAALRARLDKDRALALPGDRRRALAGSAAGRYERIYDSLHRPYSCINAATMWLLAGDEARARKLAHEALDLSRATGGETRDDSYWLAATEAEAALVLRDPETARDALLRAEQLAGDDLAKRATTRKQLRLICAATEASPAVIDTLAIPNVVHYCGHRIDPPGTGGRFPADAEDTVAEAVASRFEELDVGFGFGSLASGADILCAEALLARGAELHVVLPFAVDEFREVSVRTPDGDWVRRFDECLGRATSVTFATDGAFLGDAELFSYCSRIAMGHAVMRASFLTADIEQVAVWDGEQSDDAAGTGVDVDMWRSSGRPTHVISSKPSSSARSWDLAGTTGLGRVLRAMLFADFKGFSTLTDAQLPGFLDAVMRPVAAALATFDDAILFRNTWGDGLYLVFRDVVSAARAALALQAVMRSLDLPGVRLPQYLGLRVAAHAGPVFESHDPVRGERSFYGVHVTRTARIEPRTPEGEVYVTDPFAALVALQGEPDFTCQYVGHIPTDKSYGVFPMYVLRRTG